MRELGLVALALSIACLVASRRQLARPRPHARLSGSPAAPASPASPGLSGWSSSVRRHDVASLRRFAGRWLAGHLPRAVTEPVRRRLVAAGAGDRTALAVHLGRRAERIGVATVVGLVVLTTGSPWVLVLGPLGAWLASDGALDAAARRRVRRIEGQLPDHLDVVAVMLSAGLGFGEALRRVAQAMPGPIAEEVTHVQRQIDLGVSRRQAFVELRDRTSSPSLDAYVATLLQSDELGTPLADAVVALAADVRRGAAQDARRRAAQTAPRISLVLTTVIVPAALVLLLAGLFLGSGVDLGSAFGS